MTRLPTKKPTALEKLARKICDRESVKGNRVDISQVKTILSHLSDLIADEWRVNFNFKITTALRRLGQRRYRRKYGKKEYFKYKQGKE